jgi:hypothetical protein
LFIDHPHLPSHGYPIVELLQAHYLAGLELLPFLSLLSLLS